MEIIKNIGKFFKEAKAKILSVGTPPEEEVDYHKVLQKEAPKESAEKLTVQADIETIGNASKNTLSQAEHEEGMDFSRGTVPPPPKKTINKKPAVKKSEAKTNTAKTSRTKKAAPKKSTEKKTARDKKTATSKTKAATTVKTEPGKKKTTLKKAAPKTTTTTTGTAKKPAVKKSEIKTGAAKTKTTKSTEKKTSKKEATSKKAEKLTLYAKDIKKHYGEVDSDFLEIIVKNLGPSIYKKDAELVSCSDPKELNTVRKNFLMKKLGIDASKKVMDAAIQDVCEELKTTRTKYRATFYYSLAKKFKKESALS